MIPVEPTADGSVPTEFCLLKSGVNTYNDGDTILFDDKSAEETMRRYRARGIDLMADYEHMSLARPPMQAPASAKKWVPDMRGGDLFASQIAWTEKAKSMLSAGEYRYFSIACRVDAKSNRCVELINFALTNTPAANGIAPLVAASRTFQTNEESMKTIIVALGLNADTEESAAVSKASKLADLERDVLALTKAKSLSEAIGVLTAQAQSHEQVVALSAKVKQLESDQRGAEFDKLVALGQDSKQISPAQAKSDWIVKMRGREDGVEQLKAFLASAPKQASDVKEIVEAAAPNAEADVEITAIDRKIAVTLMGPDPVMQKKHLDELRAYRRDLKEAKAR